MTDCHRTQYMPKQNLLRCLHIQPHRIHKNAVTQLRCSAVVALLSSNLPLDILHAAAVDLQELTIQQPPVTTLLKHLQTRSYDDSSPQNNYIDGNSSETQSVSWRFRWTICKQQFTQALCCRLPLCKARIILQKYYQCAMYSSYIQTSAAQQNN